MYPSGLASFGRTTCTISLTESDAGFGAGGMSDRVDLLLIERRVRGHVVLPLVGHLVEREDRLDGARGNARAAVDALVGVDEQLLGSRELGLILARVNAVDRADIHA